jgi:L-lactate dehydrogenase complex protein LldF
MKTQTSPQKTTRKEIAHPPNEQQAFGYIYSGAIGLVVTPFHHGLDAAAGPQSLCVSCNACETVCPVEIPLPNLILDVRSRVVEARGLPWLKKVIFAMMARPRLFDVALRCFSLAQFPITRGSPYIRPQSFGILGKLPFVRAVAKLARWRSLPALATKPLRDRVKGQLAPFSGAATGQANTERSGITVCYFAGCMIDRLYPEMGEAAIKVLKACGVRVTFPQKQSCCGLIALNSGDRADCVTMARQTIMMLEQALEESKADYIVGATTSCIVTLTQDYLRLFEDLQQQGWLGRAQAVAEKME